MKGSLLICLIASACVTLYSQVRYQDIEEFHQIKDHVDRIQGSDINLLNGRSYYLLYSSISHPFLDSDRYRPGDIELNGEHYQDIPINYDICNQQIILQYSRFTGQTRHLVLNNEFIDQFSIEGKRFCKLKFPATGSLFFQVVRSGTISCYLYWYKKLFKTSTSNNTPFKYSEAFREVYFYKSGELHPIKNRSSFTDLFDPAYEKEINHFLRSEKIRFKKASDESLGKLVDFCTDLLDEG